jgi:glutamate racemase
MSRRARILIFDSGVGGLSVADEIVKKRPEADLIYAADSEFLPYGMRADAELKARVPALLQALEDRYRPDLVVIACNTASTITLPETRALLTTPVVGAVPAIKPAASLSQNRVIGFLGTPRTVEREYSDALIRDFANGCTVIRFGSSTLVDLAERKLAGEKIAFSAVAAALAPMFAKPDADRMDVAVLACTHFPLLRAEVEAASPPQLTWIDSGEAVARRVLSVLSQECGAGEPRPVAVFTTAPGKLRPAAPAFIERGFPGFEDWDSLLMGKGAVDRLRTERRA